MLPNEMIDRAWSPIDYTLTTLTISSTKHCTGDYMKWKPDRSNRHRVKQVHMWGGKKCYKFIHKTDTFSHGQKYHSKMIQKCIIYTHHRSDKSTHRFIG